MVKEIFTDRESIPKSEWVYEKETIMLVFKKKIQNRKKKGRKKNNIEDQNFDELEEKKYIISKEGETF